MLRAAEFLRDHPRRWHGRARLIVKRHFEAAHETKVRFLQVANQRYVRPVNVLVAGGGPVGLLFAVELKLLLGHRARIKVFEPRWIRRRGKVMWRGPADGNHRREQVVTVQSGVFNKLSATVLKALFPINGFTEVWPYGPDSPTQVGRPRNIRIMDVEDRLLEVASEMDIELQPKRFLSEHRSTDTDLLVICDGAQSATRDDLVHFFGQADPIPYSIDGQQLVDAVLGLRVKSGISAPAGVVMTIAQNRFLLNPLKGEGFLNMRLTPAEADEVRGFAPSRHAYSDCIQSSPCIMIRDTGNQFVCPTHGTIFAPAMDASSFLWPRIVEGLKLFDVELEDLSSITMFRLAMAQRGRFTAEIVASDKRATYAALLGDAANAIHFWPGRGLNHGILSAISLVRTLAQWSGRPLRSADFTRHEAAMAALQHRHKSRAWLQMVTRRDGLTTPITTVIREAMTRRDTRSEMLHAMQARIRDMISRLGGRLGMQVDEAELASLLRRVNDETLRVLVQSGSWETRMSSGEEVDIDLYNPPRFA